jgi:hypothetical protein
LQHLLSKKIYGTHDHNQSNHCQSNQRPQANANKTTGAGENQDRSRGSHTSQSGRPSEKSHNDASTQKSSSGEQGEHRHDDLRKDNRDKQGSADASRSGGRDERNTSGSWHSYKP